MKGLIILKNANLLLIIFLMFSCTKESSQIEEFTSETIEGVECRLTYEGGTLWEIRHTKKGTNNLTLNSYSFNAKGNLSEIYQVFGDSLLLRIAYFNNGLVESVHWDKDLNPYDTISIQHGLDKTYYSNGLLETIGLWENGNPVDTFKFFDENGTLLKIDYYDRSHYVPRTHSKAQRPYDAP